MFWKYQGLYAASFFSGALGLLAVIVIAGSVTWSFVRDSSKTSGDWLAYFAMIFILSLYALNSFMALYWVPV